MDHAHILAVPILLPVTITHGRDATTDLVCMDYQDAQTHMHVTTILTLFATSGGHVFTLDVLIRQLATITPVLVVMTEPVHTELQVVVIHLRATTILT
jgi:hypothetical protein